MILIDQKEQWLRMFCSLPHVPMSYVPSLYMQSRIIAHMHDNIHITYDLNKSVCCLGDKVTNQEYSISGSHQRIQFLRWHSMSSAESISSQDWTLILASFTLTIRSFARTDGNYLYQ